jgi:D-alanyl-D-alanine dipeptidase
LRKRPTVSGGKKRHFVGGNAMETPFPADLTEKSAMPELAEEAYRLPEGFVYLDEAVPGVYWDAKYASSDNFTDAPVDGYAANRIALSEKLAASLIKARDEAAKKGLYLLVWDAARPQRAVDRFVEWAREPENGATRETHYPNLQKSQLFREGYIATRSAHTRGAAVDLTLVDESGEMLDMGGGFDLMDEKSHHGAKGLTPEQAENRLLLKKLMRSAGFVAYSNEWWHYSLAREPFPGEYFDFVIGGDAARTPWKMPPHPSHAADVPE